jgi:cytochrome P450 family 6
LDIIKSILVKDFNVFPNRGIYFNEKDDPVSAHLFNIENDQWKNLRQKLSPTFTSGKLKMMFATIDEVSERLLKIFESNNVVEIKDILARFTTDVIGSSAFGLECNSLENPNSEFYKIGTKLFNQPSNFFKRFMRNSYRDLARKMHIKQLASDISEFYLNITKETIEYREKNRNVQRQDFMNLLIEMKRDGILTTEQIAAQSFVFYLAGYETSSSTMTYCMYELAINEDIQEKARNSVIDVLKKYNNNFTYDAVAEMNYLECCVNETLRKYPVVPVLQRTSVREYEIPTMGVKIPKNQAISIPVYAIHHDPEIYPEPEKFKPERFEVKEVSKRHPMAFLPFGEGPSEFLIFYFLFLRKKFKIPGKNIKYFLNKFQEFASA